jgi:hypothetical protein
MSRAEPTIRKGAGFALASAAPFGQPAPTGWARHVQHAT